MIVRSFRLSDHAPVTRLLENALSEACYEETIEAFAKQLSWDSDLVLLAQVGENVAGIIIGTIDDDKGYYYRIAVHPEHRRQGIGRALVQAMKTRFTQKRVSRVFVSVDAHNEQILGLYESVGYKPNDFLRSEARLRIVNG